jgi:hypothetical protein
MRNSTTRAASTLLWYVRRKASWAEHARSVAVQA